MSKPITSLPLVGIVRRDGIAYRVTDPVPLDVISGLIREPWCSRLVVTDARSGGACPGEFTAMCVVDGEPFVLVGRIRQR